MEGIAMIGAMLIGVITAFLIGFYVGNSKGYVDGLSAAADQLKEIHDQGEEEIKRIEKEINPDCGWR